MIITPYSTPNLIGEFRIPVPLQNRVFKSYCEENRLTSTIPVSEIFGEGRYTELNSLLRSIPSGQGILFSSAETIFHLPEDCMRLFNETVFRGIDTHFILERFVLTSENLAVLEDVKKIRALSVNSLDVLRQYCL